MPAGPLCLADPFSIMIRINKDIIIIIIINLPIWAPTKVISRVEYGELLRAADRSKNANKYGE